MVSQKKKSGALAVSLYISARGASPAVIIIVRSRLGTYVHHHLMTDTDVRTYPLHIFTAVPTDERTDVLQLILQLR